jgi:hypothetical protein
MLGCFRLTDAYAADDMQWPLQRVQKGFAELFEKGFAYRCERSFYVLIRYYLKWNQFENPNVGTAAGKMFQTLGAPDIVKAALVLALREFAPRFPKEILDRFEASSEPLRNPWGTLPKPVPKPEPEPEPEPKSKPKPTSSSGDDGDGEKPLKPFEQFWAAYPHRVAKAEAQKAWTKLKPNAELQAVILVAIEQQKAGADWLRDDGQYIPHPATWLRAGRWLDEVRPYTAPPVKLPAGWWETHESLKAAGAMLNPPLTPRTGEMKEDFRRRINQALGNEDRPLPQYAVVEPPKKIEREYIPPTVPEGVQLTEEQRQARREELREAMKAMSEKASNARAGVTASSERQAA